MPAPEGTLCSWPPLLAQFNVTFSEEKPSVYQSRTNSSWWMHKNTVWPRKHQYTLGPLPALETSIGNSREDLKQGANWELGQKLRCPQSHVHPLSLEDGNKISLIRERGEKKCNNLNGWSVSICGSNLWLQSKKRGSWMQVPEKQNKSKKQNKTWRNNGPNVCRFSLKLSSQEDFS